MAIRKNPKAEYIKYKLKIKKSSQTKVAEIRSKECGRRVSFSAVYNVVEGLSESGPIKRIISRITGEKIKDLWPDDDEEVKQAA